MILGDVDYWQDRCFKLREEYVSSLHKLCEADTALITRLIALIEEQDDEQLTMRLHTILKEHPDVAPTQLS